MSKFYYWCIVMNIWFVGGLTCADNYRSAAMIFLGFVFAVIAFFYMPPSTQTVNAGQERKSK